MQQSEINGRAGACSYDITVFGQSGNLLATNSLLALLLILFDHCNSCIN